MNRYVIYRYRNVIDQRNLVLDFSLKVLYTAFERGFVLYFLKTTIKRAAVGSSSNLGVQYITN